jgi:uncharacterized membrane-anchored protein YhcB (DUF1043 family)
VLSRLSAAALLAAVLLFLGLSVAAQPKESLDSIRARFDRQRQEVSQKLRTQKVELMKLMALDNPNSSHIKKKLNQILETEEERQYLFVDEMFAVRNAMTEQEWRDYRRSVIFMMMDKKGK